jgi:DNA-binding HxlR family transcriptional regulator
MGLKPQLCVKFHQAVELIGSRWTGAVIQLLLQGRMRFAELRDAIPDISDRMLSERLRELEAEGIVERLVIPETPVRVEYELTDKGRALELPLAAVGKWAERWVSPAKRTGHDKLSLKPAAAARASAASEPRARREPAKRRPRARVGESEGRSPSEKT